MKLAGQNRTASVKKLIGLYSLTGGGYTIDLGKSMQPATHLLTRYPEAEKTKKYRIHESASGQQISGFFEKWTGHFFIISPAIEFNMSGSARSDGKGIDIFIRNMTSHTLTDCLLFYNGRFLALENIQAGTDRQVRVESSAMDIDGPFSGKVPETALKSLTARSVSEASDAALKKLLSSLFSAIHQKDQSRRDFLYLIGLTPSAIPPADFCGKPMTGEDMTLVTWKIPVGITR
jgi:hypothetical protein